MNTKMIARILAGIVALLCLLIGARYMFAPASILEGAGFDPAGPNDSQGYISEVATRALIFIEADNPRIGLMCIVMIGMAEVSSCDVQAYEGQHLTKGQPLGTFHFGGSSHCILFRNGVDITFDLPKDNPPGLNAYNLFVNSQLATVK